MNDSLYSFKALLRDISHDSLRILPHASNSRSVALSCPASTKAHNLIMENIFLASSIKLKYDACTWITEEEKNFFFILLQHVRQSVFVICILFLHQPCQLVLFTLGRFQFFLHCDFFLPAFEMDISVLSQVLFRSSRIESMSQKIKALVEKVIRKYP